MSHYVLDTGLLPKSLAERFTELTGIQISRSYEPVDLNHCEGEISTTCYESGESFGVTFRYPRELEKGDFIKELSDSITGAVKTISGREINPVLF
jgi:hypothetical protein